MANMNFGVNILPKATNTYSLGNSDYKWLVNGFAINEASEKEVDTSITSSSSVNLPTTSAVVAYILSKFANPVFTGTLSMGRLSGSTVGSGSVALGADVTASGTSSFAVGNQTIANHYAQMVLGEFNVADASTAQATARGNYILIVGNGTASNARSDAMTLDWSGNLRVKGTMYVGANADGSGGSEVALSSDVSGKADKADTVLTSTLSCNRKANTTVGTNSIAYGYNVTASGERSFGFGSSVTASSLNAFAVGSSTTASGNYSFAQGISTTANIHSAVAINYGTTASGKASFAQGDHTTANHMSQSVFGAYNVADPSTATATSNGNYIIIVGNGTASDALSNALTLDWNGNLRVKGTIYAGADADGTGGTAVLTSHQDISGKADKNNTVLDSTLSRGRSANTTVGTGSVAFGRGVTASGGFSVAFGDDNVSSGSASACFGASNTSSGNQSFAIGNGNTASGAYSFVQGIYTIANHKCQSVFGAYNVEDPSTALASANGDYIIIVGNGTAYNAHSNAMTLDWSGNERLKGTLYVNCNADGTGGTAVLTSHQDISGKADKSDTVLSTTLSRGRKTGTTVGTASLAFGNDVTASGTYSVAFGNSNVSSGSDSFTSGYSNTASESNSSCFGYNNTASGNNSVCIGSSNTASANQSVAIGYSTTSGGVSSLAIGNGTSAIRKAQFAFGEYNIVESSGSGTRGSYVEIVGNGTASNARSNARTLDWSGNMQLAGDLTLNAFGQSPLSLASRVVPFTGATSNASGSIGLVPAPQSSWTHRFLRSNGSWDFVYGLRETTSLTKGTNPSSTTYYMYSVAYESGSGTANENRLCYFTGYTGTSGTTYFVVATSKYVSNTNVVNKFQLSISKTGTCAYEVSDPSAFRTAINAVGKGCTWGDLKGS